MHTPDEKGETRLQRLRQVEKSTKKRPRALDGPDMPEAAVHVWQWFRNLQEGRTSAGWGPSRMSWSDLEAFFRLYHLTPRPWEVRLIRAFEGAFLATINRPGEQKNARPGPIGDRGGQHPGEGGQEVS